MAIFNSDFEAAVYIILIGIVLYILNKMISVVLSKIKRVSAKQENKIGFILSLISFIIIVYLIIEGFPSFEMIDPTYSAILTGAISTALAFASRGIFSNIVSGIILMIISPADVGDVVKIKGTKGIIRQITDRFMHKRFGSSEEEEISDWELAIKQTNVKPKEMAIRTGLLFSAGLVAGEALTGVVVAVLIVLGIQIQLLASAPWLPSLLVFGFIGLLLAYIPIREILSNKI